MGDWPQVDWVQAADSLSFLEVGVDPILSMIGTYESGWTIDTVRAKFDWMYYRIKIPEACALIAPLYELALQKLRNKDES